MSKVQKVEVTNFGVDFYREAMKFVNKHVNNKEDAQMHIVREAYKYADTCKEYAVALIETGLTAGVVAGYKYDEVMNVMGVGQEFADFAQERWLAF